MLNPQTTMPTSPTPLLSWLLAGDVALQYQVYRDLRNEIRPDLQQRIWMEGWGAAFLHFRHTNGNWGKKYYEPKWTSTHYTLLDLRHLEAPAHPLITETLHMILREEKGPDGGIRPIGTVKRSDVCVNGMFLNVAAYFDAPPEPLASVVDFILAQHMPDGGFNCQSNRQGARHSSLHTTVSVLEGLTTYLSHGYRYRASDVQAALDQSVAFLLLHRLYLSDRTGAVIHPDFLRLSFPCRWRYDILRGLEALRAAHVPWDERMRPAIDVLLQKRHRDGYWVLGAHHAGQVHFGMEMPRQPSRWNTLRALRVLQEYAPSLV